MFYILIIIFKIWFQYFIFILLIFLGMVTGAILVWKGDISKLEEPFFKSLERFDDQSQQNHDKALVQAWNTLQTDVGFITILWMIEF